MEDREIYERIGEDGFARLVSAFYRQVPHDDVLGPMYPSDDMAGAEERLRDFLVGRFGGPPRYVQQRGHPRLRMRHVEFAIDRTAALRWLELMDNALRATELPQDVEAALKPFFRQVAAMMINRE